MRVLIIYYSQSGNTREVAKQIAKGVKSTGADFHVCQLKDATYDMLEKYDLIGIGSPTWKADTPNMHKFIDDMPDQKGRHWFVFNTHGTLPHLYFPVVNAVIKSKNARVIGYRSWYGDVAMPGMPKPYYTVGHPDAQDLEEARDFGREMAENSPKIAAGKEELCYPDPEINDKVVEQALLASTMFSNPDNPQGNFHRDPEKCHYPECHVCMDNCTMGYIDLSKDPQVFGNRGSMCDDCHECSYCYMICPFGAIYTDPPMEKQVERELGVRHLNFEKMLDRDEKEGLFRRHIKAEDVGYDHPYIIWHPKRPYLKVPRPLTDEEI
ncbi:MAG: EFR1 family ferrodoxin [Bilifractor sp.]|jgi:ferredoxin